MQLKKEGTNSSLTWNDGELEITGRLTQLRGGKDLYEVGVYLGNYDEHATYYIGDSVTWNMAGEICTYHCIKENANGEAPPSDSEFWKIVARGAKGDSGPSGTPGAPIVYRGDWQSSKEYYGNPNRLDVVKYEGRYYITKIISGVILPNSPAPGVSIAGEESKWGDFGANFDSVAVDLLFAEGANIGGWNIIGNKLASKESKIYLDGNTENILVSGKICLDTNGLTLYGDTNREADDIKAQVSITDIDTALNLGVDTDEKTPTFTGISMAGKTIYGINSGRPDEEKIYKATTGNLVMSEKIGIGPLTKAYFKDLTVDMTLSFRNISDSAMGEGFGARKLSLVPIVNGERKGIVYY